MAQLHGLGWLPDIPSHLDYTEEHPEIAPLLSRTRLARRVPGGMRGEPVEATIGCLPPQVDLRPSISPVEAQSQLRPFTGNPAGGLLQYFDRRTQGNDPDPSRIFV